MDPNENLKRQREIVARIQFIADEPSAGAYAQRLELELGQLAFELADLVEALDNWMSRDGYAPSPWLGEDAPDPDDVRLSAYRGG